MAAPAGDSGLLVLSHQSEHLAAPMYILLSGVAIGLSFSLAIAFILFKTRFTSQYIHWLSGIFIAWLWFDHIWLGTREAFNNQVLVMAIISLATLLVTTLLVRKEDYEEESDHGQ
jgi:ABC-type Fe3+-siderophore transport system permease subunit